MKNESEGGGGGSGGSYTFCQVSECIVLSTIYILYKICAHRVLIGIPSFTVQQGKEHVSETPKLEAKATPIEELLAAEEQSAAQAASKKAKKQQQKAKKQQQKQNKEQQQQEQQAHEAQQQHQLPKAEDDAQPPVLHRQQPDGTAHTLINNAAENGDAERPFDVMQPADASSAVASSLSSLQLDNVRERQRPDADKPLQQQSPQGMPDGNEDFLQNFFCCPLTKVQPSIQAMFKHVVYKKHGVCK